MNAIPIILLAASLSLHAAPPKADRAAILSMVGTFEVSFSFTEDALFVPAYEVASKPYSENATELVLVAEDTPQRIILQHLLVVNDPKTKGNSVIKHWGQVWSWEDTEMLNYEGSDGIDEWRKVKISKEEATGKWTQLVTSVDDTPRYEGLGKWTHTHGISKWIASDTQRPLPRREYSKRDDYDYILGSNTHVITAQGWLHFQDNLKVLDRGEAPIAIAHETGLNRYTRTDESRAAIAKIWWGKHHETWSGIRDFWIAAEGNASKIFSYTTSSGGKRLSKTLDALVLSNSDSAEIAATLNPFLTSDQ